MAFQTLYPADQGYDDLDAVSTADGTSGAFAYVVGTQLVLIVAQSGWRERYVVSDTNHGPTNLAIAKAGPHVALGYVTGDHQGPNQFVIARYRNKERLSDLTVPLPDGAYIPSSLGVAPDGTVFLVQPDGINHRITSLRPEPINLALQIPGRAYHPDNTLLVSCEDTLWLLAMGNEGGETRVGVAPLSPTEHPAMTQVHRFAEHDQVLYFLFDARVTCGERRILLTFKSVEDGTVSLHFVWVSLNP